MRVNERFRARCCRDQLILSANLGVISTVSYYRSMVTVRCRLCCASSIAAFAVICVCLPQTMRTANTWGCPLSCSKTVQNYAATKVHYRLCSNRRRCNLPSRFETWWFLWPYPDRLNSSFTRNLLIERRATKARGGPGGRDSGPPNAATTIIAKLNSVRSCCVRPPSINRPVCRHPHPTAWAPRIWNGAPNEIKKA